MNIWKDRERIKDKVFAVNILNGNLSLKKVENFPDNIIPLPEGSYSFKFENNPLKDLYVVQGNEVEAVPLEINAGIGADNYIPYAILTTDLFPGAERELKKVSWENNPNIYDVIFE